MRNGLPCNNIWLSRYDDFKTMHTALVWSLLCYCATVDSFGRSTRNTKTLYKIFYYVIYIN